MEYVVIEHFNGTVELVRTHEGTPKVFSDLDSAELESKEVQNGIVVPLTNIISKVRKAVNFIGHEKDLMGSSIDPENIEEELGQITWKG